METKKISKKTLNSLLNDSMREVISNLELPKPTKKVQKVLDRSSKKLAAAFANVLKKQNKKAKKERKNLFFVEDVLNQKKGKKSKHLKNHHAPVAAE
jgi:hypothetical protein